MKRMLSFAFVFALTLALFSATLALASDTILRLRTELEPTTAGENAEGDAEWKEQTGNRLRLKVDVKDVPTDGTGKVVIKRDGDRVFRGNIEIEDGDGRLELDTQDGDDVPVLAAGDKVIVRDSDGVKVLQGTLEED